MPISFSQQSYYLRVSLLVLLAVISGCGGGGAPGGSGTQPPTSNPIPAITSLSPATITVNDAGKAITVNGSGFMSSSAVLWNGTAHTATFVSSSQLQMTIGAADIATVGTIQISVSNPTPGGGTSSASPLAIQYPAPSLTSLSLTTITALDAGSVLTLNGTGFLSSSVVMWNSSSRASTFVSSTQLQLAISAADVANVGTVQIAVSNPTPGGGTSSASPLAIQYPTPTISSLSPTAITMLDAGGVLTVTGTGFVPSSAITWNGNTRATTFVSSTQLQMTISDGDVSSNGNAQVAVSNPAPGGGISTASAITIQYPLPSISSLSPNAVMQGSTDFILAVNGSGFVSTSVIQWNGTSRASTYVSASRLTTIITAAEVASTGSAQITVYTPAPGGGTSTAATFSITTYPVPVIQQISPSSAVVGSPDAPVIIYGYSFASGATVQLNGSTIPSTYVYSGQIQTTISASQMTSVQSLSLTVTNPSPGGGTSNSAAFDVTPNLVPTINSLSPSVAPVGSAGITLTIYGSGFSNRSSVLWNDSPRPTTFGYSSQVTATISSSDLATLGTNTVKVFNPAPGGGTTSASAFTTYLPLPANDLVYNSTDQLLYASIPSSAGASLGNSVISIDPFTGNLGTPIWVGSEPNKLALSSDGTVLWVGLDGAGAVRQVNLSTRTPGLQFSAGGVTGSYNPPLTAKAMAVLPGSSNTIAVATSSGVSIYDTGVARAKTASATISGLAWSPSGTALYAAGYSYYVMTVDASGISNTTTANSSVSSNDLRYDSGSVYLTSGTVLKATDGTQQGVFSLAPNQPANGPVAPDSSVGKAFMLVNPNYGSSSQINAYDLSTFVLLGSMPLSTANNYYYSGPGSLVRWGQDGLAFKDGTGVYVLRSTLVRDLSSTPADLSVTATAAPPTGSTGVDLTYNFNVTNNGTSSANPVTLVDTLPSGTVFKSVTPSQGACAGAAVIRCNLGTLSSGDSLTIQIVTTPLSAGTLTNTVIVGAPQGDPNAANNTLTSITTVTGSSYTAMPSVFSLSPSLAQAGSDAFTLTVNGAQFDAAAVVQWNGTALTTTYVSPTQLTAQVDASSIASMGWASVNVSNPSPGGGTSASLPFTTFQVVDLDTNRTLFDPFTRQIYASVPSTATQVTGNSIVVIDPSTGAKGTPINAGSEPNRLAESDDGKYLYVGLDGAKSLTRFDLTAATPAKGAVYPMTFTTTYGAVTTTVRDMAVVPGNRDTLAVDTGSSYGIGVFDISPSSGTMRTTMTGFYPGSNLIFADATTLYSYDIDYSGQFSRWTLGATGLTVIDRSSLSGIGGYSGSMKLHNGQIYGAAGGLANPNTTPPSQVAQYQVQSALGLGQTIQGNGVAPDAAAGRVFYMGTTLAGTLSTVLLTFDQSHYEMLGANTVVGVTAGRDFFRWGKDGLAFTAGAGNNYPGTPTPGTGKLVILRGPLVLPQLSSVNPAPTLSSSSPASTTAGSGNLYVTLTGTNFVPGAIVLWNDAERTTTYVDSTHLKAAIPASDVATAGTQKLKVANPPWSAASGSIDFSVN